MIRMKREVKIGEKEENKRERKKITMSRSLIYY